MQHSGHDLPRTHLLSTSVHKLVAYGARQAPSAFSEVPTRSEPGMALSAPKWLANIPAWVGRETLKERRAPRADLGTACGSLGRRGARVVLGKTPWCLGRPLRAH